MKLAWTRRAGRAFAQALDYLDERNPDAASQAEARILHAAERLRDYPTSYREGRVGGTREQVVQGTPFILVYRIETKGHYDTACAAYETAVAHPHNPSSPRRRGSIRKI